MSRTFPFFVPIEHRCISQAEREILMCILQDVNPAHISLVEQLQVVGRCGCGACPTIFFQPHAQPEHETQVASYWGRDEANALVGVLLWEKHGHPSQLEFYSVDGHEPWGIPKAETIEPF